MAWNLAESIAYYKGMGAPGDQNALVQLLREIQQVYDGGIPMHLLDTIAEGCGVKKSFLEALIRRIPSLRLADTHTLRLCAGPNCGKHTALAACAEKLAAASGGKIRLISGGCMRMCGKGPNIVWDGKVYNQATEELLKTLAKQDT